MTSFLYATTPIQADVSIDIGIKDGVSFTVDAGNTLLVNTDPSGNGAGGEGVSEAAP
jgi:hypothetical protein